MQKRKVNGIWRTILTNREVAKIEDAAIVLSEMDQLGDHVEDTLKQLGTIRNCIDDKGVYSEAVPEVAGE